MYPPLVLCLLYLLPVYCHWGRHHHNYPHHHRHNPNPSSNNHNYHHHHNFHHDPNFQHTAEYHNNHGFPHHHNHGHFHPWPPTPVVTVPTIPVHVSVHTTPPPPPTTVTPRTTTQPPQTTTEPPLDPFDQLFCDVYDQHEDMEYFCHNTTKETVSGGIYRITAQLQGYQINSIQVKIKYRVLSITATSTNGARYQELIILPTVADNQNVAWEYDGTELNVYFSKLREHNICTKTISSATITVEQLQSTFYFSY